MTATEDPNHHAAARPPSSRRRVLLGATGLAGVVLGGVGGAAVSSSASAEEPHTEAAPGEADVVVRQDGVSAPNVLRPGLVTLRVTTPVAKGLTLLLVKVRVPLKKYLTDLAALGATRDPKAAAALARTVESNAENYGGAVTVAGQTVTYRQLLSPGEYHLVSYDHNSHNPKALPVARPVRVAGRTVAGAPKADGLIVQTAKGFWVEGDTLPADGTLLVVNRSGQLNEAMLIPVKPGTTDADIQALFQAMASGEQPSSMPFTGSSSGLAPQSPERFSLLRSGLKPGPYLLSSWITSTETGLPRVFGGAYRLVTLT